MAKKITSLSRSPVFSLPWLVADEEGLFAQEGIEVDFVSKELLHGEVPQFQRDLPRQVWDWHKVDPLWQGAAFERGDAQIYGACEWGQVNRAHDSVDHGVGGKIVGKGAAIAVMAIFSAPGSKFTHPQALRNQTVAVRFWSGAHYATLQQLEGFLERAEIKLVHMSFADGYEAVRNGEVAAIALIEPWIALAEKEGFQKIIETHYQGSEISRADLDPETFTAINRALDRAVDLINIDKKKYLHYLVESLPEKYRDRITTADFHLPRLRYVKTEPYGEEEFSKTYEWMVSWGLVNKDATVDQLVDNRISAAS